MSAICINVETLDDHVPEVQILKRRVSRHVLAQIRQVAHSNDEYFNKIICRQLLTMYTEGYCYERRDDFYANEKRLAIIYCVTNGLLNLTKYRQVNIYDVRTCHRLVCQMIECLKNMTPSFSTVICISNIMLNNNKHICT